MNCDWYIVFSIGKVNNRNDLLGLVFYGIDKFYYK